MSHSMNWKQVLEAASIDVCKASFEDFLKEFWHEIIPEQLQWNWHMTVICSEMQKMAERVFNGTPKEYDLVCNVPPGSSKPVWEEELILCSTGKRKKLKDIVVGDRVLTHKGRFRPVLAVHEQGLMECLRIESFCGRAVHAELSHPFLTPEGWVQSKDLVVKQCLALPFPQPKQSKSDYVDDSFSLAGYFIGDGSCTWANKEKTRCNCSVTSADGEYVEHLVAAAGSLGFSTTVSNYKASNVDLKVVRVNTAHAQNWLRETGIAGKNSYTKVVPDFIFNGSNEQVAKFIAAYFHCDGCISKHHPDRNTFTISFSSVSKELLDGVQHLLYRFGINARVRKRVKKKDDKITKAGYTHYVLDISDTDNASKFFERIPVLGRKKRTLESHCFLRSRFHNQLQSDPIVSIEPAGMLPCRCLTVEEDSSFTVNDIAVHNSTVCSIMFPAWIWTRMPSARIICSSYSYALSLALSMRCRDIVKSEKYKRMFGVSIREDQDQKGFFKINGGGERFATSTGGSVVGMHGHFLICDDPINMQEVLSPTMMNQANNWLDQTFLTRKVDKAVTPFILIQQRLSETDPSAHFLEKGSCRHICLPAEENDLVRPFELKEKYTNGLLDELRMPKNVLEMIRKDLGEYGYAGQFLQSPSPLGGGMFQTEKLTTVIAVPAQLRSVIRYWDKAGTVNAGCYTVGLKMGVLVDGRVIVLDIVRGRWGADEREKIMRNTALADGVDVKIFMEQEGGSGGKESAMYSIRNLAGFTVEADLPKGNKALRADPFASQMGAGNVMLLKAPWNFDYVQELSSYPNGRYLDQIDASSGAFNKLSFRKRAGVWGKGSI